MSKRRVFIVDDHQMMRQGLRVFLERESDLEVCGEADNGAEALARILEMKPCAVIVDISLPGMNGIEFLKNLKAQQPEVAAIVVSAHDESVYAERALRAGAHGYVMKKEAVEEITVALRCALDGEYHVSKSVTGAIFHKALAVNGHGKSASIAPTTLLSDRELEVFELLGKGKSTREIAKILRLSGKTVETHRAHIKEKCGLTSNTEMIQHATIWMENAGTN
ncbi:MAG: response regulator transcription factor [Opitutaceae bacterium]